jgi:hypothetical protein
MVAMRVSNLSIEEYAKKTHRIHPILSLWIKNFFCSNSSFKLSARTEAQILLYTRKWVWKKKCSIKQAMQKVYHYPEDFWQKKLVQLNPKDRMHIDFRLPLFLDALRLAWVWITPWSSLPSGRASRPDNTKKIGNFSFSLTPCFMFLNWQIWGKGILNFPGNHAGNCFDLATDAGLALYLHEIYHIYQFLRNPLKLMWGYIRAVHDSMVYAKILFSHPHISFELEAIAFEMELISQFSNKKCSNLLAIFEEFR